MRTSAADIEIYSVNRVALLPCQSAEQGRRASPLPSILIAIAFAVLAGDGAPNTVFDGAVG
jgi:hypothetical protein